MEPRALILDVTLVQIQRQQTNNLFSKCIKFNEFQGISEKIPLINCLKEASNMTSTNCKAKHHLLDDIDKTVGDLPKRPKLTV